MDSSISELVLLKYKKDEEFFKKAYPCSLRPQGKEIVRTWLYYTLLRGYLETGKSCFEDVWVHQHILDSKGFKMSKSKGNIIDPQKLLKNYGAEAIRFWAAIEGDLSKQDLKCSEERIRSELKTLSKLLNVSKFVMLFPKPEKRYKLTSTDELFVDYIENLTQNVEKDYEKYDFYHPALELRKFLWDVFASHYLELVKARAYNKEGKFSEDESYSAQWTLYYLLERLLILLHPIIPQITSLIAKEKGVDLLKSSFPKAKIGNSNLVLVDKIMNFNSKIWKKKKDKEISLKSELKAKVPEELLVYKKDLKACHNLI